MPSRRPSLTLGIVTVVLTLVGWSSVPLFLRHFADLMDFWTSNGWRYGFSAIVWMPVLIIAAFRHRLPRGLWKAALIPSIANAAGQVCFTWAHYKIDPALLTFGLRSQLLFVALGAWALFPKERAVIGTAGYLVGAALLVAGMVGVLALDGARHRPSTIVERQDAVADPTQPSSASTTLDSPRNDRGSAAAHWQGVALAVGSGLLFAAYGLAVRKFMDGINPVLAFAAICQYTALALVVLMLVFGRGQGVSVFDFSGVELLKLLLSALIGIAIGHVFYYISIARLGVAVTAGVLQLQPFIVAVGSMALFGERLGGWQWAGGCVAVTGALLMLGVQRRVSRRLQSIEEPVAIAEGESGA